MFLIYSCIAEEIIEQWKLISVANGILLNFVVTWVALLLCTEEF
jgi:hypothetical protein